MTAEAEVRARLVARLGELETRAGRLESQLTQPMSADSEEQAIQIENEDTLAAEDALVLKEMASVRWRRHRNTVSS